MQLNICHLYPDVLNLYGDGGNIITLTRRLRWRGIEATVTRAPIGSPVSLTGADFVFIGGGQDFEQQVLLEDLHRGRDREIRAAIEDGIPFLTICGGYQMLGSYYETYDGQRCDFIGALDLCTVGSKKRMIGNYKFQCTPEAGGSIVVGFENHSGKTRLGSGVQPGAHYKNVFGSYSHGPMLPKNPAFADLLLATALERKYGNAELQPLDDRAELAAHDEMCAKL